MRQYIKYILPLLIIALKGFTASAQYDSTKINKIVLDWQNQIYKQLPDSLPPYELNQYLLEGSERGDTNLVLLCLKKGANVNIKTGEGVTPLMFASQNGFLSIVKNLIINGADVNAVPDDGRTALIAATTFNHDDVMDYLIQHGAFLNARTTDSTTALFYAAAYGYYIPVDMLLFYGANAKLAANDGTTPLMIAALQDHTEIVDLILKKDSATEATDNNDWTALLCAAYKNNTDIVKMLVDKGARVNQQNKEGYSALAIAAINGNSAMAEYLLKHGADASLRTKDNATPYRLALYNNQRWVLRTLKKNGVKAEIAPVFNTIEISPLAFGFNNRDFMFGLHLGIQDIKYHIGFNLGYDTRFWADRMLVANGDNSFYQFWERRSMFYLNAEKLFCIGNNVSDITQAIFIEGKEIFTYGKYHASTTKPKSRFLFAPGIGYQLMIFSVGAKAAFEYVDLGVKDMPPLRLNISLILHIDRKMYMITQKYAGNLLGE